MRTTETIEVSQTSAQEIIAAITGATTNAVSERASRRTHSEEQQ